MNIVAVMSKTISKVEQIHIEWERAAEKLQLSSICLSVISLVSSFTANDSPFFPLSVHLKAVRFESNHLQLPTFSF